MISLDEPKKIQNQNRVFASNKQGSYDTVIKNIRKLWERQPDYAQKVSLSMVINPENSYEEINSLFNNKYIRKMRCNHSIVEKDDYENVHHSEEYLNDSLYNYFLGTILSTKQFRKDIVKRTTIDEIGGMLQEIKKIKYGVLGDVSAPGRALFTWEGEIIRRL